MKVLFLLLISVSLYSQSYFPRTKNVNGKEYEYLRTDSISKGLLITFTKPIIVNTPGAIDSSVVATNYVLDTTRIGLDQRNVLKLDKAGGTVTGSLDALAGIYTSDLSFYYNGWVDSLYSWSMTADYDLYFYSYKYGEYQNTIKFLNSGQIQASPATETTHIITLGQLIDSMNVLRNEISEALSSGDYKSDKFYGEVTPENYKSNPEYREYLEFKKYKEMKKQLAGK